MKFLSRRPRRAALQSIVLAGLLVSGAVAATPAFAGWDSIAVDDDTNTRGGDAGYGVGQGDSKGAAEADAMANCRKEGNTGCKTVVSYKDMCGAYASSKEHAGYGTGPSKGAATKGAMSTCGTANCKLVVADCVE